MKKLALIFLILILVSCENSTEPEDGLQSEIGIIVEIIDATPVDGGIEIKVRKDNYEIIEVQFGSLFTYPPPDDEKLKLLEKIRKVKVGDLVILKYRFENDQQNLVDIQKLN
ncbi:MAG: hypothetical protein K9J12_01870 [Melioribacteraceae bacterium]|nr:hypothetical protein [Melioribacteraceae bacterium]MCF8266382.1 hypothetical protein [Melioribacteraceae bacterium]MCF8412899.1 hypothetical protein [Melioribacteraceae bacterium]